MHLQNSKPGFNLLMDGHIVTKKAAGEKHLASFELLKM